MLAMNWGLTASYYLVGGWILKRCNVKRWDWKGRFDSGISGLGWVNGHDWRSGYGTGIGLHFTRVGRVVGTDREQHGLVGQDREAFCSK